MGLVSRGAHRRRGQVALTVAAPGVGKSVLALTEAAKLGVSCLYLSLDTDAHTTLVRLVQSVTRTDRDTAEAAVEAAQRGEDTAATRAMAAVAHLRMAYPHSPSVEGIAEHVWAYAEAEGAWPHLIVVDNLSDIASDGVDEWSGLRQTMIDLTRLAAETHAHVHVLHHASGQYEDGHQVIPASGINGKVAKKPSLIYTLNRGRTEDELWVSVVKNRHGRADPSGLGVRARLRVDYAHMQMGDG
jgi:KaiC/GvpD/RAD55 family RecA-like ATPase